MPKKVRKEYVVDPFVIRYSLETRDKLRYIADWNGRSLKGQFMYMVNEEFRKVKLFHQDDIKMGLDSVKSHIPHKI